MEKLQIFQNNQFGEVRTILQDGEPWFVGNDVATALGYAKARNAVAMHVDEDDALKQGVTDSLGRTQETVFINESGVYSLVFGSKLESAKAFKRWITHEVIPAIRKTGTYSVQQKPATMLDALSQTVQALQEQERQMAELRREQGNLALTQEEHEKKLTVVNSRLDTLNGVCTEGDKQQKLNAMIRSYAVKAGIRFDEAWKQFRQSYNNAYHTNITTLRHNFMDRAGIKKMSVPEYLMKANLIDDGLRIADKMLSERAVH